MKTPRARREEDVDGFLKPLISQAIPEDAISYELVYRTLAAKYKELLSRKRQIDAEMAEKPDESRRLELGAKLTGVNGQLGSLRTLARDAGELAYATVFLRIANELMSKEAFRLIDEEVRSAMRRPKHEIKRSHGAMPDSRYPRLKGIVGGGSVVRNDREPPPAPLTYLGRPAHQKTC